MKYSEPNSEHSGPNPDRLAAYAGLLTDVSFLITELKAYQDGKDPVYRYSFDMSGRDDVELPGVIDETMPYPDSLVVHLRQEDDEVVFASVDFVNRVAILTISDMTGVPSGAQLAVTEQPTRSDVLQLSEGSEIPPIGYVTPAEFNKMLLSLILPGTHDTHVDPSQTDLLAPATFPALRGLFDVPRPPEFASVRNPFEVTGIQFDYQEADGLPINFQITYPENTTGRLIHADGQLDVGLQLPFYTLEDIQVSLVGSTDRLEGVEYRPVNIGKVNDNVKVPYFPTTEEINYLRSIIQTELNILNPVEHFITEDDLPAANEGVGEAFINGGYTRFSPKYTQAVLDQLSFNPPDPSA